MVGEMRDLEGWEEMRLENCQRKRSTINTVRGVRHFGRENITVGGCSGVGYWQGVRFSSGSQACSGVGYVRSLFGCWILWKTPVDLVYTQFARSHLQ